MSMPSLSLAGAIFLLYPAVRAAKVLSREEKLYIVSVLNEMSIDVPVAGPLANHILEFEMDFPTREQCQTPLAQIYGDNWDIKGTFIGG